VSRADCEFWSQWRQPKRAWRRAVSCLYTVPDRGWFGLTPLRTHVLVCGYPRSGTTVLQMMLEYAIPAARRFGTETRGYRAALYAWRNHAVMISKQPGDVLKLPGLRALYAARPARLRAIVTVRDPRDVLTSVHASRPGAYFLAPSEWRRYDDAVRWLPPGDDVLLLRYEDMVADVDATQARLEAFIGEPFDRPLRDFHREERSDFETIALNGVRPVDRASVARWQRPEHAERLRELEEAIPGFGDRIEALGYGRSG
jgi:uncharacterized protein YjeT (DUF2065 family)